MPDLRFLAAGATDTARRRNFHDFSVSQNWIATNGTRREQPMLRRLGRYAVRIYERRTSSGRLQWDVHFFHLAAWRSVLRRFRRDGTAATRLIERKNPEDGTVIASATLTTRLLDDVFLVGTERTSGGEQSVDWPGGLIEYLVI